MMRAMAENCKLVKGTSREPYSHNLYILQRLTWEQQGIYCLCVEQIFIDGYRFIHDVEIIISNDAFNMELTSTCISKFALRCHAQRFSRYNNIKIVMLFRLSGAVTHTYRHVLRFIRCRNLSTCTTIQPVTHYRIKRSLKIKHYDPSGAIAQLQLFQSIRLLYINRIVAKVIYMQTCNSMVLLCIPVEKMMIIQKQESVCSDIQMDESVVRIFQCKLRIDALSLSAQSTATRGERDSFSPQEGFPTPYILVGMGYIDEVKENSPND
ncbi:MAG: hypothetical protein EZS28_027790 [Streblomastix strix]|uniref:Uncharacterized protein n=1 Tax=Streblomastix strix TaxID=222440 RepID=A0A5J4V2F7_9EUKA|nr:MAG: hypothetical protein EZS28_027790 [Streblomastix strix]